MTQTPSQKKPPPATTPDESFRTVDEHPFMQECAARINAFIQTYPQEAGHVLCAFVPYRHELVEIHTQIREAHRAERGEPQKDGPEPGVTFAALFAAILQTHHGVGYYLAPVMDEDPRSPTFMKLLRVEVKRQGEDEASDAQA